VTDPLLQQRRAQETRFHAEVQRLATRVVLVPWMRTAAQTRLELAGARPDVACAEVAR